MGLEKSVQMVLESHLVTESGRRFFFLKIVFRDKHLLGHTALQIQV